MKISVCIPTYNSAEFVRGCIESVLSQTRQDFEIVVSDNASTDDTCRIVEAIPDSRIRLLRNESNRGIAANMNRLVAAADGEYIKILCSDDLIDTRCLEVQAAMLDRDPSLVMSSTGLRYIDAGGNVLRVMRWFSHETVLEAHEVVAATLMYGNVIGGPSATLIRSKVLRDAGPFSLSLPVFLDVEMWLRLSAMGPIGFVPDAFCDYRLHPKSMTDELRKLGVIRNDVLQMTEAMLQSVNATSIARRVVWGRVAGSFLKQALSGFRHGYIKWPLKAIWEACQIDPAFVGLIAHQALFRPGLLRLQAGENRTLTISPVKGR
jgi:hypothetical protein